MTNRIRVTLMLLCFQLSFCNAAEFYVAPDGNDTGSGTLEDPLKTLFGAQKKVRLSSLLGREPINIYFREGAYYLGKTFRLDARDSGTKSAPVLYTAYLGEKVILSGGVKLTPSWEKTETGIYQTELDPGLHFDQLFIDGQKQTLARFPNFDANASPYNGASAKAFSKERAQNWKNPAGGFIHAMHRHHWGGYHYQITGKSASGEVTYEGGWQNNRQMGMHAEHRMVENIREELDAPGEWFLDDSNGILHFNPANADALPTALVEVATLKHLVEIQGSSNQPVQHVSLRGFTFRHATRTFMETREPLLRSDWTIYRGGAVVFQNSEDCNIQHCEFDQLGGNGIFVNKYNRRVKIVSCHLHHCGASGICFVGDPNTVRNPKFEYRQTNRYHDIDQTPGPKGDTFPSECTVEDCLIHNMSMVEKQATGVQVSMSHRITIRHCSIYDMGRAGINISEGTFGGHLIEHCDVFNTVRETGDHGSFNSWGRDRFWHLQDAPADSLPELSKVDTSPTIIRNSRWRCDRGWDVDLDDGSSHYEIYNNLFLQGGLKLREGFYRNVHNNISINNSLHPHVWYDNSMDTVTRNIWMGAYRPAGGMPAGKWGANIDHNLFTTVRAKDKFYDHDCDHNSVVGDPLFIDPEHGDYRVGPNSPAFKIGFKNFPMHLFGVRSKTLRSLAEKPPFPIPESPTSRKTDKVGPNRNETIWMGLQLRTITAEQFSAFGVNREEGGLTIIKIAPNAETIFEVNDVIQQVNAKAVRNIQDLHQQIAKLRDTPILVQFVRNQQTQTARIQNFPRLVVETVASPSDFRILPVPDSLRYVVFASPSTNNDPLAILSDKQLSPSYGPVFSNGVHDGSYKTDLGSVKSISRLSSWSYGQDARGTQNIRLYGSAAAQDPGWDPQNYSPIGSLHARGSSERYTAAALRARPQASLGRYRWILWRTLPVTNISGGENTALQELAVEVALQK